MITQIDDNYWIDLEEIVSIELISMFDDDVGTIMLTGGHKIHLDKKIINEKILNPIKDMEKHQTMLLEKYSEVYKDKLND